MGQARRVDHGRRHQPRTRAERTHASVLRSDRRHDAAEPILALRGVTKRFGGATALDDVDFELLPGEIHGLVGENGAGKSTLMKILSGVHTPDEGEIVLRGEAVQFASPADAKARGIGMIYQELSCMPALTVAENVFLGSQPTTRRADRLEADAPRGGRAS